MIIHMLCVTIFVTLDVWFLLPRGASVMIHTTTAISILVCLSMVEVVAVFISMRCTLCGHFLQVALTVSLLVGFFFSSRRRHTRSDRDWSSDVCSSIRKGINGCNSRNTASNAANKFFHATVARSRSALWSSGFTHSMYQSQKSPQKNWYAP